MGNANSKSNDQDKAILNMKLQRDRIKKYQRKLEFVMLREDEIAREEIKKRNKKKALLALRKKKYQQGLINKTDEQLILLENLLSSIEFASIQKDVVDGLDKGNKILAKLNQETSIERVDKIMDDSISGINYQNEVSDILSNSLSSQDEADVQEELEKLEGLKTEDLSLKLPSVKQDDLKSPINKTTPNKNSNESIKLDQKGQNNISNKEAIPA